MDKKPAVIAAMSGGVDSSAAAALLKKEGYTVIGATLRLRSLEADKKINRYCGMEAEEQSKSVAKILEIEHRVIDATHNFESEILYPAWQAYDSGKTPSPCILCNERIKFKLLFELGKKLGIDRIATGHYALIDRSQEKPRLMRGKDLSKDQSYFLFALSQEHLNAALFPLGELHKIEVRALARKLGFPNAARKDSQDACFSYGDEGFAETLRIHFNAVSRPGAIINADGERIGNHEGIHLYTIGQRKGLRIATGKRAYVCGIDATKDRVVLSSDPKKLECRELTTSKPIWTTSAPVTFPFRCKAQIRYRHTPAEVEVFEQENGCLKICFDNSQTAAAPGQAVVLYDNDIVLGGAWIEQTAT